MACIFLGCLLNHMVSSYRMLNIRMKHNVLSHDIIWLNITYGGCVSRQEHTKFDSYILQYEDNCDHWSHVKMILSILKISL